MLEKKKIKEMIELNQKTLSGIKSSTYYNEGNRIICRDCLYRIEGEIQDADDEDEGMGYYY